MTPEGKIKARFKSRINGLKRVYQFWPVQTGMGAATLDWLGCVNGRFVSVEFKADATKHLTPRQKITQREMVDAGAVVLVVYDAASMDGALEVIRGLIEWGHHSCNT